MNPAIREAVLWRPTLHDGISLNFQTGQHYVKAIGGVLARGALTDFFTFTGGNQSRYMGPAGLLVSSVTNTPRIEYDASGNCLGLLIEGAKTNLCLQSQDFGTTWAVNSCSVSANAIASPDGTTTADKLVEAAATARHYFSQSITKAASSIQYAVSAFFKSAERTFGCIRVSDGPQAGDARVNINLSTGTLSSTVISGSGFSGASAIVTAHSSGWYRVTLVFTSSTDTTLRVEFGADTDNDPAAFSYAGDGTSGLYIWGAQVEAGAFPSSYIPTTTGSVARTAESCIRTLGAEFSATAGTVVVKGRTGGGVDASFGQSVWAICDGGTNERFNLIRVGGSTSLDHRVVDGGVLQNTGTDVVITNLTAFKSAMAWSVNDLAASFNGAAALVDGSMTLPTVTQCELGTVAGASQGNCHIRTFDYWPTRLPNADLLRLAA